MKNKRNHISSLAVAGVVVGFVLAACGDPDEPGVGAGAQLPQVHGPASRGVEIELELQSRAEEARWQDPAIYHLHAQESQSQVQDRHVVAPRVHAPQGPASQAEAIEEARWQDPAIYDLHAQESQSQVQAPQGPASQAEVIEATVEAHSNENASRDDTDAGELVPDLRMR